MIELYAFLFFRSELAQKTRYRDMSDEEEEDDWDNCDVETASTLATQPKPKSKGSRFFSLKKKK